MIDYKQSSDDISFISSVSSLSMNDSNQQDEAFTQALQKLNKIKDMNPKEINNNWEFFYHLLGMVKDKKFSVDPSTYINTSFLSD